jgi:hypothetical protein
MFWLENPAILLNDNIDFNGNFIVKLNFITKYLIIISLLLTILFQNTNLLLLIPIFCLFIILIRNIYITEKYNNNHNSCTSSTIHNPFMNPSVNDLLIHPNKPEACEYDFEKTDITDNFYKGMFRNVTDIYNTEGSLRQFYTIPNTHIPNNQEIFAKWLYDDGKSCKEGNYEKCIKNINLDRTGLTRVLSMGSKFDG